MAQVESHKRDIKDSGARLVFVAAQTRGGFLNPEKHLASDPISFPFLLDEDRAITRAYGVHHLLGLDAFNIAHPATFVIDRQGMVRYIFVGESQTERAPIEEVIKTAKKLADEKGSAQKSRA